MKTHPLHRILTMLALIMPTAEFTMLVVTGGWWNGWPPIPLYRELVIAMSILGMGAGVIALALAWRTSMRWIAMVSIVLNCSAALFIFLPTTGYTHCEASHCPSHIKMLAGATLAYSEHHNGRLPSPGNWNTAALKYSKSSHILFCPDAGEELPGYAMNKALAGVKLADLKNPSEMIMFFECRPGRNRVGDSSIAEYRHKGGCHVSYADTHVKWLIKSDFEKAMSVKPRIKEHARFGVDWPEIR